MLRTLLLLAALLPEARAEDRAEAEMIIRVLGTELSVPTRSSSLPESLRVGFSAPDSLTVEVSVSEGDTGGYGILLFDTTSSLPELLEVHDWWSLCLAGACPPIEVAVEVAGEEVTIGILTASSEPAAGPVGTPEWKYVPIRRL